MRRGTEGIANRSLSLGDPPPLGSNDANSDRLAAMAALTVSNQSPGLVLPSIAEVPSSYTYTSGNNTTITLARSLVQLGLGSTELWKRHNANPSLFVRSSVNEWLDSLGGGDLDEYVRIDLAIVEELEGNRPEGNKLYILFETSDGCGFLGVGQALQMLEHEEEGLGRAFYVVLMLTMYQWLDVYDMSRTEYFVDRWKESIEMDMEDGDGSEESFQEYCRANEISFPDLVAATPACVRDFDFRRERRQIKRSLALLTKHKDGACSDLIKPVLTMALERYSEKGPDYRHLDEIWDDGPLPNWVVAFDSHDPITQAFDEERQSMYESSHAPTWISVFDPANLTDVRRVLNHIGSVVRINRHLVDLARSLEGRKNRAGTDQS